MTDIRIEILTEEIKELEYQIYAKKLKQEELEKTQREIQRTNEKK